MWTGEHQADIGLIEQPNVAKIYIYPKLNIILVYSFYWMIGALRVD